MNQLYLKVMNRIIEQKKLLRKEMFVKRNAVETRFKNEYDDVDFNLIFYVMVSA